MNLFTRRSLLRRLGLSAAALPFASGLPGLKAAEIIGAPKKRVVFVFSPNGIVPWEFWPDAIGEEFQLKKILAPLEPFKKQFLSMKGLSNKAKGDGDGHMRGISCLLTGIELNPGNIQGGSDTPAGWAKGPSIDQELKNFLQKSEKTRTRFGSLELGVAVPNRADPWTRWTYAGPNQPVAPISDPYEVFQRLYGSMKDRESLGSVLDEVSDELNRLSARVGAEDRALLDKHATFVREMEKDLQAASREKLTAPPPVLPPGVRDDNDDMPKVSAMQIEMLVNAFANDMARVATLQYTNSVGGARMRWLGVDEGHHQLSHDADSNTSSQEKLIKIDTWYCEQVALLAKRLSETPEPGGDGNMLDHTTIIWTNELGKGNSHSHDDVPFICVGGGLGWKMGRTAEFGGAAHNRLLVAIAQAFGHDVSTFGNRELSDGGALVLS